MRKIVPSRCYHVIARWQVGFTVIELLVVISIIALLIAMLLPVLKNARRSAKVVMELSNLRQVGLAVHTYSNDYNGLIPGGNNGRLPDHKEVRKRLYANGYLSGGRISNSQWISDLWRCPLTDDLGIRDELWRPSTWLWNVGFGNATTKDGDRTLYTALDQDGPLLFDGAQHKIYVDGRGYFTSQGGPSENHKRKNPYKGAVSNIVLISDAGVLHWFSVIGGSSGLYPGHTHVPGLALLTNINPATEKDKPTETTSLMLDGHASTRTRQQMQLAQQHGGGTPHGWR